MKNLLKKLRKPLILDGAMGTELHKAGMPDSVCPELWMTQNPQIVEKIQNTYILAGSDAILIPSFGANQLKLAEFGLEKNCLEINRKLAAISRNAAKSCEHRKILIGADIGPTGKMLEPSGQVPFEIAVSAFKEQIKILCDEGADFIIVETMLDIQEARAALIAAKETTNLPVIVSMTFSDGGRTLSGTSPAAAIVTLQSLGADAVGANCSLGPDLLLPIIQEMKKYAKVPLSVKPNAGLPRLINGETVFDMSPEDFAKFATRLVEAGASLIGGCCGTNATHIKALYENVSKIKLSNNEPQFKSVISSARTVVSFDSGKPLKIVGERINPTGKKVLKEEILKGSLKEIIRLAAEQELKGADILDVNVGAPGADEKTFLPKAVLELSFATALPLCIDSSNTEAVEAALRIYPGRALINSISNEKVKIKNLLPAARKYGAMFILLPLGDGDLPVESKDRIRNIKKIMSKAEKYGFSNEDVIVDGLVLTAAANPKAPLETLKTIEWAEKHSFRTIVGLSNVSFGLPQREKINSAFLSMCIANGLTASIANPSDEDVIAAKFASDALCARDESCALFVEKYIEKDKTKTAIDTSKARTPSEILREAVLKGDRNHIQDFLRNAINSGLSAESISNDIIIPAIREVGDLYNRKIYFMPQLIMSAEAVKKAFEILDPLLSANPNAEKSKKKTILLATVKGDVHDIGKNIVALVLKNHGYNVIDLGKDVPPETIAFNAKKHQPFAIGLSALMTTTMPVMKTTIDFCLKEGISEVSFIVGGAVVDPEFAESIGALYAKDAIHAVNVLDKLIYKKK